MKNVVGYENIYGVTSCGRIWSYKRQKFLTPFYDKNGYLRVQLWKNGKCKNYKLHRLVADAYIPNPDNLSDVDHIDNDKTHNYLNNLQWITHKDNVRKGRNRPILQYTLDGEFVREWECAYDVGKVAVKSINNCLKGRNKTAYGFVWKYKESEV